MDITAREAEMPARVGCQGVTEGPDGWLGSGIQRNSEPAVVSGGPFPELHPNPPSQVCSWIIFRGLTVTVTIR